MLPINPFLEYSFIKTGTDIAHSEKLHAFVDSIPEVRLWHFKRFVDKNIVSDAITSNNFVVSAEWTAKADPKKSPTHKEFNYNKLREAALFRLSQCAEVAKIEMAGLPKCTTVTNHSY